MDPLDTSPSERIGTTNSVAGERWGVLLLAHGAPDKVADVPEFLLNVRSGRPLPHETVQEIMQRYERIGGGSPLLTHTRRQADALAQALNHKRSADKLQPLPVEVGMRNWKPFIADAVRQLAGSGVMRIVAVCLAPQNSRTSVGLYRRHLDEAVEGAATPVIVRFVSSWHDHPELIAAFSEKISQALVKARASTGTAVPVILTAHSVPLRTIDEGDPYKTQVGETARLVAEAAGLECWSVAYQSQGLSAEPWLGPTVESKIEQLAGEGYRHVLIAPIGFVSDHVEVLYDIDIGFHEFSRKLDVTLWRSESLNDSPLLIRALQSLVEAEIDAAVCCKQTAGGE